MHRVRLGKLAPLLLLLVFSLGCGSALELDTKTIKVKDDRYLTFKPWMHYSVKGSGRPLILIHDLLTNSYTWRKNVDELAEQRCGGQVALDLGRQQIPERELQLRAGVVDGRDVSWSRTSSRARRGERRCGLAGPVPRGVHG